MGQRVSEGLQFSESKGLVFFFLKRRVFFSFEIFLKHVAESIDHIKEAPRSRIDTSFSGG